MTSFSNYAPDAPAPQPDLEKPMTEQRTRARSFALFEKRFHPLIREHSTLIWNLDELPAAARNMICHWWTVLDCDGKLYLSAGLRFVNRIGYVRCQTPWTDPDQHIDYRYD
jgi:hypothetical protein